MLHISQLKHTSIYTRNQIEKLGNALIFVCQHIRPASTTQLLNLVFIIEEIAVKKFGIPFFNLKFDVWKLGPVSKDLFVELTDEPNLLHGYIDKEFSGGQFQFVASKTFSDDEFNDDEISLLTEVVSRFQYCTAKELVHFTHRKNALWYTTAQKNGILDLLENGKLTTTDVEIDLATLLEDEPDKLARYLHYQEFLHYSKSLQS